MRPLNGSNEKIAAVNAMSRSSASGGKQRIADRAEWSGQDWARACAETKSRHVDDDKDDHGQRAHQPEGGFEAADGGHRDRGQAENDSPTERFRRD